MISIELYDNKFNIKKQDFDNPTLEKQLSIDCMMKIIIGDKKFYDDCICPLEFYNQIRKWYNEIIKDNLINFYHITMDNDENPILAFIYDENNNEWLIDSVLRNYREKKKFSTEELKSAFKQFEKQLMIHIN